MKRLALFLLLGMVCTSHAIDTINVEHTYTCDELGNHTAPYGYQRYNLKVRYHQGSLGDGTYDGITCTGGVCNSGALGVLGTDRFVPESPGVVHEYADWNGHRTYGDAVAVTGCYPGQFGNTIDLVINAYADGVEPTPTPSPTPGPMCRWSMDVDLSPRCPGGSVGNHVMTIVTERSPAYSYGPFNIPAGSHDINAQFDGLAESGAAVCVLVDGVTVFCKVVTCLGDPPPPNVFGASGYYGEGCSAAPTPVPTTTPYGSPLPTPPPGSTVGPGTTPPGGGSGPGPSPGPPTGSPTSAVAVSNFNDFYEPIKKAVRDSGNDTVVTAQGKAPLAKATMENGDMDAVTSTLDGIQTSGEGLIQAMQDIKSTADEKVSALTVTFGSDHVLSVPITGSLAQRIGSEFRVDFSQYSTGITIFRTFLEWCLFLSFFILTVRATVYTN